ncbi:MAG: family 10 glycosylhydrolase [Fimbriimonadales bacterium]
MSLKVRGVWCGSHEAGFSQQSVDLYVGRMHDAGFNAIFVHLKGGDGKLYWPSPGFPDAVAEGYEAFDLPAALLRSCRERGMQMHAWLIDFFEGEKGAAFRKHPEWAMLDGRGRPTNQEMLRGDRFTGLWMCPARRPGYTDQWLVPVLKEFAERYDVDSIHHDYVRYPGDLAPDQYCFCDYCLEQMPKFNGLISQTFPHEPFYHELYDREYLEAHWEPSPRVLPRNWELLDRNSKARFLLEGAFFQGGRADLDYFLYAYRRYWITEFTRECAEAVRAVRPKMKISAAVFKNPIHSGRFIGQDWRDFSPYVDICVPMDYRDHFPGSFEQYLPLLTETIQSQKIWARDYEHLWIGSAINFLFFEEQKPLDRCKLLLQRGEKIMAKRSYETVADRLREHDPAAADQFESALISGNAPNISHRDIAKSYWPAEKLSRVVQTVENAGVEGLVFFCEGHLNEYGLWDAAKSALS